MKDSSCFGKTKAILFAVGLGMIAVASTGCQVSIGGQTLPSPYYVHDDVQYFPAGQEFKLAQEAAAMKAFNSQQQLPSAPAAGAAPVAP